MSINAYCGLQGSGKSFEVVAYVIVPAIAKGRRVVTNIDGINPEKIREFASKKHKVPLEACGEVVFVSSERMQAAGFFPVDVPDNVMAFEVPDWVPHREFVFYAQMFQIAQGRELNAARFSMMLVELTTLKKRGIDLASALVVAAESEWKSFKASYFVDYSAGDVFAKLPLVTDPIVKGGDLVCIDEAWKLWGDNCKLSAEHRSFIRMHRHYLSEDMVSCDVALMTQDIQGLNRFVKGVIQNSFRMHKARGLGFKKLYSVSMWEGIRQTEKLKVKDWVKVYDAEVFPLYQSYAGGQGKELAADDRQSILTRGLAIKLTLFVLGICWCIYWLFGYVERTKNGGKAGQVQSASSVSGAGGAAPLQARAASAPEPLIRIVGTMVVGPFRSVILESTDGVHLADATMFKGMGLRMTGVYDGKAVSAMLPPIVPVGQAVKRGLK